MKNNTSEPTMKIDWDKLALSDLLKRYLDLYSLYYNRRDAKQDSSLLVLLRYMLYMCMCEEQMLSSSVFQPEPAVLESLAYLSEFCMNNLCTHSSNFVDDIFSLCVKSDSDFLSKQLKAPPDSVRKEHFLKWIPENIDGVDAYSFEDAPSLAQDGLLPSSSFGSGPDAATDLITPNSNKRAYEGITVGMDKNQSPSVLESQNMTSGSWPNFSKKKQRNYIYGREDYATVTTTESHERSNEFHTALSKYERDQELKHGKSLPATWQQQKKKKRQFRSPLISSEEEDDQGDEERKKDRSRIDTSTSLKKNNSAIEEFKGIDPEIAERVLNEILDMKLNVHWNDISGLDDVKQVLHEMIILPSMHPEMFRGLRTPPRGLLLFGPPGNGKTMIAKAIATEAKMTFFSISASVLCSKWIGEGEKTMRALFTIARAKAPAFVFIDEIDSILCARSSEENESSRRLKNEFLLQFDGATTSSEDAVIVMGATNRPFDLDDAARRRLPKRIYVPLPEEKTRSKLLRNLLHNEKHCLTEEQIEKIAQHLEGYSCSDIHQISQHAAMGPVRDIMKAGTGKILGELRPICYEDFLKAISMNRPSVALEECKLYEEFAEKFGTKGF